MNRILKNVYVIFVNILNHKQLKKKLKTIPCVYILVIARLLIVKQVVLPINPQNDFIICDKAVFPMLLGRYRK